MQDKPSGAGNERATTTTAAEDDREQARVLNHILDLHPETTTLEELVRELSLASTDFAEQDRLRRAVRELIGVGLLHQLGDLLRPTRAAVRFDALEKI